MNEKEQTLDEHYSLVIHQAGLQEQYLKGEISEQKGFIFFIIFLIVAPLGFYSGEFLLAIFLIGFLSGPFIIIFLIHHFQKIQYYKGIQELYRLSKGTEKRVEDFHEILMLLKKLKKILYKKGNKFVGLGALELEIRANQYRYFSLLLHNLNTDLVKQIKDIGKTLESAKSEVDTTIIGTPELTQVSALQSARLDRQIEQFEELQKVLVKM